MSRHKAMHARDGQRRDALAAWWRGTRKRLRALAWHVAAGEWRRAAAAVLLDVIRLSHAPAPAEAPAQETPRTGDPRSDAREVRSGATTTPGAAVAVDGTRQDPALPAPEAGATTNPSGGAAAPPLPPGGPVPAGQGRRSPGQPIVWERADGEDLVIGYGPRCEMPAYRGDYKRTEPFRVVDDSPAGRPYYAEHLRMLDARAVSYR